MTQTKPTIGISLDWCERGTFSKRPHYALRTSYFDAIYQAGGIPVGIPFIDHAIDEYLSTIDGLLVPGGDFANDPNWYVSNDPLPYEPSPRLAFDIALIQKAIDVKKPLLTICAGMQILGGIQGCKLSQNIHQYLSTTIDHLQEKPAEEYAHSVKLTNNTLLHRICGQDEIQVNTAHQEAIVSVPDHIIVNATAPDGVIEGIELQNHPFAIGVQWHPEFFANDNTPDLALFKAFVQHANDMRST